MSAVCEQMSALNVDIDATALGCLLITAFTILIIFAGSCRFGFSFGKNSRAFDVGFSIQRLHKRLLGCRSRDFYCHVKPPVTQDDRYAVVFVFLSIFYKTTLHRNHKKIVQLKCVILGREPRKTVSTNGFTNPGMHADPAIPALLA
jgi:hypothetical protein